MNLIKIDDFNNNIFSNLLEKYLEEINNYEYIEKDKKDLRGPKWLEYFYETSVHFGYFIEFNNEICGFVLVCNKCFYSSDDRYFLSEFYIAKEYRRLGLGKDAATRLFTTLKGKWELSVHPRNLTSIRFWDSVLENLCPNKYNVFKGISGVFDSVDANIYTFEIN